jgi:hypothetical protein
MKQLNHKKNNATGFKGIIKISVWMILICSLIFIDDSGSIIDLKSASANVQYGIQGQPAPELNLTTWIDGDGQQIDPIKLINHRGKVIYLYFFQDW